MKAPFVAVLSISAAAILPMAACQSGGGKSSTPAASAMSSLPEMTKNEVNGYLGAVRGFVAVLAGVTDTPSASAAMPRIEEYIAKIQDHGRAINAEPPETRRKISEAYGPQFAAQNDAYAAQVNRIKGTPGLGSKLGPLLDKVTLLK